MFLYKYQIQIMMIMAKNKTPGLYSYVECSTDEFKVVCISVFPEDRPAVAPGGADDCL